MRVIMFLLSFLVLTPFSKGQMPSWEEIETPVKASLRGLSPVSDRVCWASGSGGAWLKTVDGGKTWTHGVIGGLDSVDFRSIHAFNENKAIVASAGQPAVIFLTEDGGATWTKVHQEVESAFFDAITFIDKKRGFVLGDPIEGKWMILETLDGGRTWSSLEKLPDAVAGEAAFAASSSSLIADKNQLILGTGGSQSNLHFYSFSKGYWKKVAVPLMIQGQASQGIFALTRYKEQFILAGGDYVKPELREGNLVIFSKDEFSRPSRSTKGYRSGITSLKMPDYLVAVGPDGSDFSKDGGLNWATFSAVGYHAVKSSSKRGIIWASGSKGRIGKLLP
jgi:photosystem II stability/assembly factor-like uncharacterized protein